MSTVDTRELIPAKDYQSKLVGCSYKSIRYGFVSSITVAIGVFVGLSRLRFQPAGHELRVLFAIGSGMAAGFYSAQYARIKSLENFETKYRME